VKLLQRARQFLLEEEGQSTVEYMLLISVIVIAIVAAAYVFIEPFKQGVQDLGNDVKKILSDGKIGRVGTTR
jgi:Flp pilus assembly pilin Flp